MLVLSACHKTTEDSVTNPSTPRDQQTKETTNYFHYLADSYQKALSHEKESKDTAVQSPMAATVVAMEELQLSNPTDQALIMKNYSDFQKLIQYNTEKWEEEFASWASSMGQSYHRLEHTNFDEKNELIKKIETTTVSQKSVKWNVFGVSRDNAYDYLILDAYYDKQNKHFYLFTLKDGQSQVLHTDKTLETIPTANFEETKNTDLAQNFKEFLLKTSVTKENEPDIDNSSLTYKIKKPWNPIRIVKVKYSSQPIWPLMVSTMDLQCQTRLCNLGKWMGWIILLNGMAILQVQVLGGLKS